MEEDADSAGEDLPDLRESLKSKKKRGGGSPVKDGVLSTLFDLAGYGGTGGGDKASSSQKASSPSPPPPKAGFIFVQHYRVFFGGGASIGI